LFKRLSESTEKSAKNIAVSLNVGVIIAAVALLVSVVALVITIGRPSNARSV
jgi:hypothetical protein